MPWLVDMPSIERAISNEAGLCQQVLYFVFLYWSLFFLLLCTLVRWRRGPLSLERCLVFEPCSPYALSPVSVHRSGVAHQPSLRSARTMMKCSISLTFREAGSLINRSMTVCTVARF